MRKQIVSSFRNAGLVAEVVAGVGGLDGVLAVKPLPCSPLSLPIDGRDVAGRCLIWLLSDACWQDFGYPARPARGRLARFIAPRQREVQESFLRRELLSLITAAYFSAGCLPRAELPEVIALYSADPLLFGPLGFDSPIAATQFLEETIAEYMAVPVDQWHAVLLGRGRVRATHGPAFTLRFENGCLKLGERMVLIVGRLSVLSAGRA